MNMYEQCSFPSGTLENGKEFDSSRKKGRPFTFCLGAGNVIQGK